LRKAGIPYLTRFNENKQEIARLYKENIKIYEIARILNMNPGSVINNLINQKLLPVIGSHILKRKLLLEEYQNGNTDFQKLSASYNIRIAEVQRICTGNTKPSRNEIKERTALILQLHHQGKTVTGIKQITGLPKSKIWRTLCKNGIHSNDFETLFKENCKKIFPLLQQQKSIAEISSLLHVGQRTVKKARKIYFDKETDQ
jgi:DNA-binding CsgD family transcriptional regulator